MQVVVESGGVGEENVKPVKQISHSANHITTD